VYKPSNVEPDFVLVGNSLAIRSNEKSLTELANEFLGEDIKLPTDVIYPCNNDPIEGYGFTEYLSHEPWPDFDVVAEFYHVIKDCSSAQRRDKNAMCTHLQKCFKEKNFDVPPEYIDSICNMSDYIKASFHTKLTSHYLSKYQS